MHKHTHAHTHACMYTHITATQTFICSIRGVASSAFLLSPTPCSSWYITSLANFAASSQPVYQGHHGDSETSKLPAMDTVSPSLCSHFSFLREAPLTTV